MIRKFAVVLCLLCPLSLSAGCDQWQDWLSDHDFVFVQEEPEPSTAEVIGDLIDLFEDKIGGGD